MAGKICPRCGTREKEILKGRAGCPNCFAVFRTEIAAYLQSRYGAAHYVGDPYIPNPSIRKILSRVAEAEADLHIALSEEDYERAARLRDTIRELRRGIGGED